jgi:cyclic pyranopterin phosphate synthase
MVLKDKYGRPLLNLRIAVTKKCNLHCSYCHGEGELNHAKNLETEMTPEEISRIIKIAVSLDICRVKLTGGEPLMRSDILETVRQISSVSGLKDLSMTTNGTLLSPLARELHSNGLRRVNISVPTLRQQEFYKLTGGNVEDTLQGVRAAVEAGFFPVKLNMLILKGINDSTVPEMVEFASKTGTILQLIELEQINISNRYFMRRHKQLDEYEKMLEQKSVKVETREFMQNRRIYHLPHATVEVVKPIENTEFCLHCTRIRVTSNGKLKPCLMRNDNMVDILTPMRKGASDRELAELFMQANMQRQPYSRH